MGAVLEIAQQGAVHLFFHRLKEPSSHRAYHLRRLVIIIKYFYCEVLLPGRECDQIRDGWVTFLK